MVSCSSNEDPEPKYLELEGTWMRAWIGGDTYSDLSIDNNGNITLVYINKWIYSIEAKVTYAGKIEDNFEYPYTVKLTQTAFYYDGKILSDDYYNGKTGAITFSNASNCSATVPFYYCASQRWFEGNLINFKKN